MRYLDQSDNLYNEDTNDSDKLMSIPELMPIKKQLRDSDGCNNYIELFAAGILVAIILDKHRNECRNIYILDNIPISVRVPVSNGGHGREV